MPDRDVPLRVIPAPPGHWYDGERLLEGEWVKEAYPVIAYAWQPDGYREAYVVTAEPDPEPLTYILDHKNFRGLGYRVDPAATHRLYDEPGEPASEDGR